MREQGHTGGPNLRIFGGVRCAPEESVNRVTLRLVPRAWKALRNGVFMVMAMAGMRADGDSEGSKKEERADGWRHCGNERQEQSPGLQGKGGERVSRGTRRIRMDVK